VDPDPMDPQFISLLDPDPYLIFLGRFKEIQENNYNKYL
jgi:hypothetical protein